MPVATISASRRAGVEPSNRQERQNSAASDATFGRLGFAATTLRAQAIAFARELNKLAANSALRPLKEELKKSGNIYFKLPPLCGSPAPARDLSCDSMPFVVVSAAIFTENLPRVYALGLVFTGEGFRVAAHPEFINPRKGGARPSFARKTSALMEYFVKEGVTIEHVRAQLLPFLREGS